MNKPHIYKGAPYLYYCLDGRWLGWGVTGHEAYEAWRMRGMNDSCIHQRETPLQRRRRAEVVFVEVGKIPRPPDALRVTYE